MQTPEEIKRLAKLPKPPHHDSVVRKTRHWRQRWTDGAKYVFTKAFLYEGKMTKIGQPVPADLLTKAKRHKLKSMWEARRIALAPSEIVVDKSDVRALKMKRDEDRRAAKAKAELEAAKAKAELEAAKAKVENKDKQQEPATTQPVVASGPQVDPLAIDDGKKD